MKKLLLICALVFSLGTIHAQDPDPDLFRSWYLYELQVTDLDPVFIVNDIEPPILPTLTIESNLDFSGEGACNTFSGTWSYDGELFMATDFQSTTMVCEDQIHNIFEEDYFGLLELFYVVDITQEADGLKLTVYTLLLGYAVLRDYILPVDEFREKQFSVYPNPVSDELFISSEGSSVEEIAVYSISGQQLVSRSGQINSLDVSSLTEGIYFLEIISEGRKQVQKFVKREQ